MDNTKKLTVEPKNMNIIKFTKVLIDLVFCGGSIIWLGLPYFTKVYMQILNFYISESYVFLLIFLYTTGIIGLYVVYEIRNLLKNFDDEHPFTLKNVKSFRNISVSCALIAIGYLIKIFMFNSIFTVIICMIFIIASLFAYILALIFKKAYQVKEENDLTI